LGLKCVTTDDGIVADDGTPPPCDQITGNSPGTTTVNGGTPPPAGVLSWSTLCAVVGFGCGYNNSPNYAYSPGGSSGNLNGSNNGGAGSAITNNGQQTRQQQRQQIYQQCMADFKSTTLGKLVALGSVLSFTDDFVGTAEEWGLALTVKGSILGVFFKGANSARVATTLHCMSWPPGSKSGIALLHSSAFSTTQSHGTGSGPPQRYFSS
jgi:hypothetical protein